MMGTFVSFDLAKKLKEKGFVCDLPFAMYNELEQFYLLTTSAPIRKAESGYTYRDYYDYEDFDENDFIAPTISQVLEWLRKEKKIYVEPCILADSDIDDGKVINDYTYWSFSIVSIETGDMIYFEYEHIDDKRFETYEDAAIDGIKYVLDNLI